ncbi:hypothetical protein CAPTEDRAFT_201889 [Capitella teleta]|uniref:Zinc transporter ZIP11 n=1 Tax=Capitella teleta TaxID=283909 RepID=R7VK36_CAPTE|nr:hypothetical protein CAPTEDRAFT_201889 [Capitella teleta]|eukprot:ELU17006.1 hypothetical protein CAPTEDRAFT_201889 [Capitella teleta]
MIAGCHPVLQALLGTLFTWGLTGAGSALVFVFSSGKRKILDGSLGFAAGGISDPSIALAVSTGQKVNKEDRTYEGHDSLIMMEDVQGKSTNVKDSVQGTARRRGANPSDVSGSPLSLVDSHSKETERSVSWKRILLLIVAITIHNIPEGLAVGVGFGAIGKSATATFENARNLAIGIGIQNFPEGLAVSLPLRGSGMGIWKSFWYGQLSGMVEPIAGVFGALAVVVAEPILPYALAFAAGAMIYVVLDDIVPEAQMWYSLK